ncbi:MAG: MATE family efflux transporter [Betaproteobacteria bacterium]|nr:MATE family efflux transporter [Betaproteobacteria bacterium]
MPIAGPMFAELGIGIGAGIVGTWLASRASDTSAAAFALGNHVAAMLFILFRIVGAGAGVVIAQHAGAGRFTEANAVTRAILGASTAMGVVTALGAVLGAATLMQWMNAPADVAPLAASFLVVLAPALFVDAWAASLSSALRARLVNRAVLGVTLISTTLQMALAVPLMLGAGSFEGLGLTGFAAAQFAGRAVAVIALLAIARHALALRTTWPDWWMLRPQALEPVLRIGLPGAAENIGYRLAFMVSLAAAGTLGAQALAAQAYTLQVSSAALMFGLAIGLSMEIAIGHLAGAGKLHAADTLLRGGLKLALILSLAATALSALLAPWTLPGFSADASILRDAHLLLWLTVLLEPGRTFNLVVINALRACGDARFPVIAGIASMVLILAGGSWVFAVVLGWGLTGIWIAYIADEWCRGILMWLRWRSHAWVAHVRRSRRWAAASVRHQSSSQNK